MKLLVTGGAGFIGSHLTDYLLKRGHSVLVFDNLSTGKQEFFSHNLHNPRFSFRKLDLTDFSAVKRNLSTDIDTVFHLAANSNVMRGITDPDIDFANSTLATFNLLKAMQQKRVRKIFFTSGSGIYGDVGKKFVSETHGPLFPVSHYGATKLSAEAMIYAFSYLYNIQSWILRPANIIGPRATHGVIFDFVNKLKKNPHSLEILGDGKQTKSYLYIRDVLDAIDTVWKSAKEPINLYNISSKSFITVEKIARIVIATMALKNVTLKKSGGVGGWRGDVPVIKLDSSKLTKLGWHPKYDSEDAVIKTVQALI